MFWRMAGLSTASPVSVFFPSNNYPIFRSNFYAFNFSKFLFAWIASNCRAYWICWSNDQWVYFVFVLACWKMTEMQHLFLLSAVVFSFVVLKLSLIRNLWCIVLWNDNSSIIRQKFGTWFTFFCFHQSVMLVLFLLLLLASIFPVIF